MILEAAGACFFKLGYEGTSIGSIVERTGGSIASIYAIFGSKRGLFEAFIRDRAQRLNVSIAYQGRPQGPRHELTYLASQLLDRATRPDWLDLVRLILSELPRDEELGALLQRAALDPIEAELRAVFGDWIWLADGSTADPHDLARLFMDLIVGVHPVHLLAGLRKPRGKKERLDHVAQRVTAFLLLAQPRAHPTEGNS